jgi:hypothetical protein
VFWSCTELQAIRSPQQGVHFRLFDLLHDLPNQVPASAVANTIDL